MTTKLNETLYTISLVLTVLSVLFAFIFGLILQNGIVATIFMGSFVFLSAVVCIFTKDGNKFSL